MEYICLTTLFVCYALIILSLASDTSGRPLHAVGTLKARVRVSLGWQRFDNVRRQSLGLMIGGRGGGGGLVDGNGNGAGLNSSLRCARARSENELDNPHESIAKSEQQIIRFVLTSKFGSIAVSAKFFCQ